MTTNEPTILTADDINAAVSDLPRQSEYANEIVICCTCENRNSRCLMAHGIQCQECFYKRIPMFGSSPVSSAYWSLDDHK